MKSTARFCAAILASTLSIGAASAATTGAYVGAGLGYSKSDTSAMDEEYYNSGNTEYHLYNTSMENSGLAGRIFGGYNFTPYLGLEMGVSRFANTEYRYSLDSENVYYGYYGLGDGKLTYSFTALDLVGKAYLPLGESGFNIYGLVGVAEVFAKSKADYSVKYYDYDGDSIQQSVSDTDNYHVVRPKFGAGINYAINQNVGINLELSRIQGNENEDDDGDSDEKYIPNLDMATFSLTYKFG